MKRYVSSVVKLAEPCDIFGMATVGTFDKPSSKVKIEPDSGRVGDCYFKCFNAKNINSADQVARIDFTSPRYFIHSGDGRTPWFLNSRAKKALVAFMNEYHRNFKLQQITNWSVAKYYWNLEYGFLDEPYPESYSSDVEAYCKGFYDSEEHLAHPSYLSSMLLMPDYMQLPEK